MFSPYLSILRCALCGLGRPWAGPGRFVRIAFLGWTLASARGQGLPPAVRQISAGAYHAAALDSAGGAWFWGRNNAGQLGDGTTLDRVRPVQLPAPTGAAAGTRWTAVVAGTFHSAALRSDGSLWMWGDNTNGQLGDGTRTPRQTPVAVAAPASVPVGTRWTQVALGANHTLALRSDGTLWAWGANYWGQLGDNSGQTQLRPVRIPVPTAANGAVWNLVVTGDDHTLARASDGLVFGWGRDQRAQLGVGTITFVHPFPTVAFQAPLPAGTAWAELAAGEAFSLGLNANGTLWACGTNESGQLGGVAPLPGWAGQPVAIAPPPGAAPGTAWVHISARGAHALALRSDGSLWGWGENFDGQLGLNTRLNPSGPAREVTQQSWVLAEAGTGFTLAVSRGRLYASGTNDYGQFGDGTSNGSLVFRAVSGPLASRPPQGQKMPTLWPNPATERIHIEGFSSDACVSLIDLTGRIVQIMPHGSSDISIGGLAKGMYVVKVQERTQPAVSVRLVVE